jgi:tetratricopeptide (TPR) repeat protein
MFLGILLFLVSTILFSGPSKKAFSLRSPESLSAQREELWRGKVEGHLQNGRPEGAMKVLGDALRTDAIHPYAMSMYSYLLLTFQHRRDEAKEMAQNCLNLYPRNPRCLHTLAWAHYRNREYTLALRTFGEIPKKFRNSFDLHFHWAMTAWKARNAKTAMHHFEKARILQPNSVKLFVSLGLFLESAGKSTKALHAYHHALNHLKEESGLREFLLTKIKDLLPLYRKSAVKPAGSKKLTHPEIRTQVSLKHSKISSAPSRNANPFLIPLKSDPSLLEKGGESLETLNQEEHYELAKLICVDEIKTDCLAQLHTVINLNATNSLAISANTDLKSARALPDQSSKTRIEGLMTLAESRFRKGQLRWSLILYRKVLLIESMHPLARKNLSFLYLQFERPVTALDILEPLIEKHPTYQEALILKGYALAKLRRFSDASKVLKAAYELKTSREFSVEYTKDLLDQIRDYEQPLSPSKTP